MASNESVAAELRNLQEKWRTPVVSSVPALEAVYTACAEELEPLIARLEAPSMTPTTADEILAKRIKEECWDPDCETFDLAHCQALVGLHRMTSDPALEELRKPPIQENGGICRKCGGFTTYTRQNSKDGLCFNCEQLLEGK